MPPWAVCSNCVSRYSNNEAKFATAALVSEPVPISQTFLILISMQTVYVSRLMAAI